MVTDDIYKVLTKEYSHSNIIVFTGDPLQLPPIQKPNDKDDKEIVQVFRSELSRTFETKNRFVLTKNMRVSDIISVQMLNNARLAYKKR